MQTRISGIIMLLLSILFVAGVMTFAAPCPIKPDGHFMVCHWAGRAIMGVGAVLGIPVSYTHLTLPTNREVLGQSWGFFLSCIF